MADDAKISGGTETGNPPPLESLAARQPEISASNGGGSANAETLAIHHAGLRGGRARMDGLVPGSESAEKADRLYDVVRKWQDRNPGKIHPQEKSFPAAIAAKFIARRKPLPIGQPATASAIRRIHVENLPPPLPPSSVGMEHLPETQVGDPAALLPAARDALVRWAGTDFEPLLTEFVKLLEEFREYNREKNCLKAGLPKEVIDEIERDAKWSAGLKKTIYESGSRVLSKLANAAGISAEYKDEVFCSLALLAICGGELRIQRRVSKLIAAQNGLPQPQPQPQPQQK